jgi:hypothetical protein
MRSSACKRRKEEIEKASETQNQTHRQQKIPYMFGSLLCLLGLASNSSSGRSRRFSSFFLHTRGSLLTHLDVIALFLSGSVRVPDLRLLGPLFPPLFDAGAVMRSAALCSLLLLALA